MLGKFKSWFLALSSVGKAGVIIGTLAVASIASAASHPTSKPPSPTEPTSVKASKVEVKTETTTEAIAFDTQTIDDANLASGTDQVRTEGVSGVKTKTWSVTYTDGKETDRKVVKEEVTTAPITKVIAHGTKVVLDCPNGTYVNSDGNTVCSPYSAPSVPAGATARCVDGTYSFSQHRSGTCSHHGGVSEWLY